MTEPTRMILVVVVVGLVSVALPVRAIAQAPVEYTGGPVKAVLGKTQTVSWYTLATGWTNLPGSALRVTVPGGTSDLFSLTFTGECATTGAVFIRAVAVVDGVGQLVPGSSGAVFCQSNEFATYTGSWLLRGGPGNYRFSVQFFTGAFAVIDDWTFQVVVYD